MREKELCNVIAEVVWLFVFVVVVVFGCCCCCCVVFVVVVIVVLCLPTCIVPEVLFGIKVASCMLLMEEGSFYLPC